MSIENVIYYLEMEDRPEIKSSIDYKGDFTVFECEIKQYKFNKFLYDIVGEPFLWFDKKEWSDDEWRSYVNRPSLHTWVGYKSGAILGYFELEVQKHSIVEIKYFGLTTDFIGKKLGSGFLNCAINEAWNLGAKKVIVNTCSKDHPRALSNYLDRGFKIIKEVKEK